MVVNIRTAGTLSSATSTSLPSTTTFAIVVTISTVRVAVAVVAAVVHAAVVTKGGNEEVEEEDVEVTLRLATTIVEVDVVVNEAVDGVQPKPTFWQHQRLFS